MTKLEDDIEIDEFEVDCEQAESLEQAHEHPEAQSEQAEAFAPLTDETITQEQINEMKMLGYPKPNTVSWRRWTMLQDERTEHNHMIHMAASGMAQKDIAATLGYDQAHVSKVLNTPFIKQKVQAEIEKIYGVDHKKALKDRVMKSLGVVDEILETGKESEKAAMARWAIEHSIGKATQTSEVKTTVLSDVLIKIEQINQNQLREANQNPLLLTKEPDPFDTIISEVIPESFTVGKRSSGERQGE